MDNRWLRQTLLQCAWAASRKKDSYLKAYYHRLASRRGKKRAIVAVAHKLLVMVYHMLKEHQAYQELGIDYLERRQSQRLTHHLVKRLEGLGYQVQLTCPAA